MKGEVFAEAGGERSRSLVRVRARAEARKQARSEGRQGGSRVDQQSARWAWPECVSQLGIQATSYLICSFSFTTRPSRKEQRYQAETSFIDTNRRSSLR